MRSTVVALRRIKAAGVRGWGPGGSQGSWTVAIEPLGVFYSYGKCWSYAKETILIPLYRQENDVVLEVGFTWHTVKTITGRGGRATAIPADGSRGLIKPWRRSLIAGNKAVSSPGTTELPGRCG